MLTPGGTEWFKGTWNKTSLAEQEPVQEVEWNQLDIVGLTSTHCSGSGTRFLERGWTVSGDRRQAGVGILISHAPKCNTDYPTFLESIGGVLKGLPSGNPSSTGRF